jgi:predicted N-acetyltransferase YhbS
MITTRAYTGAADLRRMQDVVSRAFGRGVDHVGDLGWAMRDLPHVALPPLLTLAEEGGGRLLGWTWFHVNGWFDLIAPGGDEELLSTLLSAALDTAARSGQAGDDVPKNLKLLCASDDEALTARGLRRVRATWPYREELDRVAVTAGGRVAASCLAWIDSDRQWGLLEPVGTYPEFQRRGLGTAVCLDALHALRRAGARAAQVGCESGSAGSRTYHGIGFETVRTLHVLGTEAPRAGT